ncbi:MAG: nicotinate (nicotinamide) nucleotide adenylyltransferase [Oscillospiraceae bacterium]|nr:nicotinate (nicotinamide) nucleotide adenylyltransferase [Oscillospiraceae bacterium]
MKQLGLFGGSFNPIHNGHLHLLRAVRRGLRLDGITLMPSGEAPHKDSSAYAPAADRLAMCRLAAAPFPWLTVSDYETKKPGKSYTVETLRHLRQTVPDADWTLLIGSDMLLSFETWHCWEEILQSARLCAVSREPGDLPQLRAYAAKLRRAVSGAHIRVLSVEAMPLSSTEIREKMQKNADCSCLLPQNVVQYICQNRLYGNGGGEHEQAG